MDDTRTPLAAGWLTLWAGLAAAAFALFASLGLWQLQRLAWKEALIARVARAEAAPPQPLPPASQWAAMATVDDDYRRVTLDGRFDPAREVRVQASTALGRGHWHLTALRTAEGGWLLVNRGFVPESAAERGDAPISPAPVDATGLVARLRRSEGPRLLWRTNDPAAGQWVTRDVPAIARALQLDGPVAPFFVDLQAPPATPPSAAGWPRAGLTVLHFSNNHRSYALTWFALAALVAGGTGWWLRDEWRLRRRTPDARRDHALASAIPPAADARRRG